MNPNTETVDLNRSYSFTLQPREADLLMAVELLAGAQNAEDHETGPLSAQIAAQRYDSEMPAQSITLNFTGYEWQTLPAHLERLSELDLPQLGRNIFAGIKAGIEQQLGPVFTAQSDRQIRTIVLDGEEVAVFASLTGLIKHEPDRIAIREQLSQIATAGGAADLPLCHLQTMRGYADFHVQQETAHAKYDATYSRLDEWKSVLAKIDGALNENSHTR